MTIANLGRERVRGEGARFLAVGVFITLVTYALYCVLVSFMEPQSAYLIVFLFGVGLAYALNSYVVFKARFRLASATLYPLIYVAQYLANASLIAVLTGVGLGARPALAVALDLVMPISFVLNRVLLGR